MIISLPMYDWPEVKTATNNYLNLLKESFLDHGLIEPQSFSRMEESDNEWLDPELMLSQTCGLPYVRDLRGKVSLIGTPAYDIDCGAGSYFSVLIVHKNHPSTKVSDFTGSQYAYSKTCSQSGFAALHQAFLDEGIDAGATMKGVKSGSHINSIKSVAAGETDIAAIDAISFELALRHEPETSQIRVIGASKPTPGLPYITALSNSNNVNKFQTAVVEAISALQETDREELLLMGFVPMTDRDYDIIESRWLELAALNIDDVC